MGIRKVILIFLGLAVLNPAAAEGVIGIKQGNHATLAGSGLNRNVDNHRPLSDAIQPGDLEATRQLMQAVEGQSDARAMHLAAQYGQTWMLRSFVDEGANLEETFQGRTLLMTAIQYGQQDVMEYLVGQGVSLEPRDHQGRSALDYAKESGNPEVMQVLLEASE